MYKLTKKWNQKYKDNIVIISMIIIIISAIAILGIFTFNIIPSFTIIDNITNGTNQALFGGGNLFASQILLAVLINFMFVLPMAVLNAKPMIIFIILLMLNGVLMAMNLLPAVVFVVMCFLLAGLFAKPIAEIFSGQRGDL